MFGLIRVFKNVMRDFIAWAITSENDENEGNPQKDIPPYNLATARPPRRIPATKSSALGSNTSSLEEMNNGMNLTVFNATGGKVIQVHTFDPNTDKHRVALHVITDKEDLGQELGQIITRENLSR